MSADPNILPKKLQVLQSVLKLVGIKQEIEYYPNTTYCEKHYSLNFIDFEVAINFTMAGNFDFICNYKQ